MNPHSFTGLFTHLSKVRAMSAAELAERIRYRVVVDLERRQHGKDRLAPSDRLQHSLVSTLRTKDWTKQLLSSRAANAQRFLPGVHDRARMRRLFDTTYASERAATLQRAEAARQRRFEFFGQEFQYGEDIAWQTDPVTGKPWPPSYHADVPVHLGDIGYGDVKQVWELNRQQYLIDLGKAYFLTGDAENVHAIRSLVHSWIAGNPYATGVNWACALEPAFRLFSWLWAYYLTSDALDDEFHVEWLCGFYDHARFIQRHLEQYSSPYNHLIGEAAALYMVGACFPEFADSRKWQAQAQSVLNGRLSQQVYADGGSVEQSTFYHHATVAYYLLAGLTARATGRELSTEVWQAIERGLEFSMALMQPDGSTPEIGGADDGKPIRMEHLPFWDFRPLQAVGAVLFGRKDFKFVAGRFFEDALWLLGPDGLAQFDATESARPARANSALTSSGYYVMRSAWSPHADYVCFDCGEQAAGMRSDGVPNSMHGHADCLSVIVWLGGHRLLVDSGLYAYNCGGPWEAHFRETAAHNTARVDRRDQARHLGKMAWSHSYRALLEDWCGDAGESWGVGSHDGYARGPDGVTHRRAVCLRPGYVVILDEFVGHGSHELEVNYQFAPGVMEIQSAQSVRFDQGFELVWAGNSDWMAAIHCGGPSPDAGWICKSLGVRQPAPRLTLRTQSAQSRTVLLTVIGASTGAKPRVSLVANAGAALAGVVVTVGGDGYTDWIAAGTEDSDAPVQTDGLIGICRWKDGTQIDGLHIGGSYLRADARMLEQLSDPALVTDREMR